MSLPVVLVHGLRTSRTMWRAQVEALERAGRRGRRASTCPGTATRIGEPFTLDAAVDTRGGRDRRARRAGVRRRALARRVRRRSGTPRGTRDQVAGLRRGVLLDPAAPRAARRGGRSVRTGIARLPDRGARLNQFFVDLTLPPAGAADVGAGGFALDATNEVLREMAIATPLADLARIEAPVWLVNGALRPLPRRGAPVPGRVPGRAAGRGPARDAPGEPGPAGAVHARAARGAGRGRGASRGRAGRDGRVSGPATTPGRRRRCRPGWARRRRRRRAGRASCAVTCRAFPPPR